VKGLTPPGNRRRVLLPEALPPRLRRVPRAAAEGKPRPTMIDLYVELKAVLQALDAASVP